SGLVPVDDGEVERDAELVEADGGARRGAARLAAVVAVEGAERDAVADEERAAADRAGGGERRGGQRDLIGRRELDAVEVVAGAAEGEPALDGGVVHRVAPPRAVADGEVGGGEAARL